MKIDNQIQALGAELKRHISEIDNDICDAEQAIKAQIEELKQSTDSGALDSLQESLRIYGKGVRELRTNLAELERSTSADDAPEAVEKIEEEKIAVQIQKETHEAPATFRDFVKGLLMWRDTPEDRMGA